MKSEPATKKIKSPIDGEDIEAEVIEVKREENNAIILHLENGAVLKLKTDIAQVLRIPSSSDEYNDVYYRVQSRNSLSVLKISDEHSI